jgi:hypothetical protein
MNAGHERNLHLRARLKGEKLLSDAVAAQLEVPGYTNGLLLQAVFFLLTCAAVAAAAQLLELFKVERPGLFIGPAALILAEYLIGARGWFHTGVEDALWLGGMLLLIGELPSSGTPEANLVIAAAIGLAGFRVRNSLFGAAAAVFVMIWAEERLDLGVICALLLGMAACIALLRTWRRPTTEWLWIAMALVLPIAGRTEADAVWRTATISLYAIYAGVTLWLALRRPHHALFLSAMIAGAISGTDLANLLTAPPELRFACSGAMLLAAVFAITRILRDRTRGFVLTPATLTPYDDTLQTVATLTMQPAHNAPPAAEPPVSGGGSFGGAGASGDY